MPEALRIRGGKPLSGVVRIAGAKNAALPLLCATLLTDEPCFLRNVPHLSDVALCVHLLCAHGAEFGLHTDRHDDGSYEDVVEIRAENVTELTSPADVVSKMRASFLVLGPLAARFGRARVPLPGGCTIGLRPVDLHVKALRALGAEITAEDGFVEARAPRGLRGADITFEKVSVGATEHAMTAAALAEGETVLRNAAREPEIIDLARALRSMGAGVEGEGTETLTIEGRRSLTGFSHRVIPDRIETGTFMVAALVTKGELRLERVCPEDVANVTEALTQAGAEIRTDGPGVLIVNGAGSRIRPMRLVTAPHPGFPTDMQAQMTALLALTEGVSYVREEVFENRFMHVPEMRRMGADIQVPDGNEAIIRGVSSLKGADLYATDLRASVSLALLALAAEGESRIHRLHHIDRGYERIEEKLRLCGADIERIMLDSEPVSAPAV